LAGRSLIRHHLFVAGRFALLVNLGGLHDAVAGVDDDGVAGFHKYFNPGSKQSSSSERFCEEME
jgi:hypothetical protein